VRDSASPTSQSKKRREIERLVGAAGPEGKAEGEEGGGEEGEDGEKRGAIRVDGQAHGVARGFCG